MPGMLGGAWAGRVLLGLETQLRPPDSGCREPEHGPLDLNVSREGWEE
jgi:hypothetical protein